MMFFTILAALVVASASSPPITAPTPKSVDMCEFKSPANGKLIITSCKGSLNLTKDFFNSVSKKLINVISIETEYIDSIEADVFGQFANLNDVVIKNAHIGRVDANAFGENVKNVNFMGCAFEDSPNLFSKNLEELNIKNSKLDEIPVLNLPNLLFLNLTENNIKKVNVEAFARLQGIEQIDLSFNKIEELPADIFINNQELEIVYLDNNPLRHFSLNTSNNIEFLSARACQLTKFDQSSTKFLDGLSELYLNDNQIDAIRGIDLAHMPELLIIDLSNNKIDRLLPDVFENNTKLQKITLDGNKLKYLPIFVSAYDKTFDTYKFSCKNCGLVKTIAYQTFERLTGLKELILSGNELTSVAESFTKLPSLRILDLSNNKLRNIERTAFAKNMRLDTLILSGNEFSVLNANAFESNKKLIVLDVGHNGMRQLWMNNKTVLPSLQKLIADNNKITTITVDQLKVTPKLKIFDIEGNAIDCNNKMVESLWWLIKHNVYPAEEDTHLGFSLSITGNLPEEISWGNLIYQRCQNPEDFYDSLDKFQDKEVISNDLLLESESHDDEDFEIDNPTMKSDIVDNDDDDDDDYEEYEDDSTFKPKFQSVEELQEIHYAYVISLSMIFLMTAVLVFMIAAVTFTLLILKKNGSLNAVRRANIPHFKIPTWSTNAGLKKHSGSVYRPLSEDLSDTPHPKRYEFASSPTVHSDNHV
ncbi:unnamed protein product [Brassicogethes aeneus]|uniref:Uncharacterized protein n=1 Tax=Brassicogethes aeneus TaxID=1431903 RepID=A0A9P0FPK4_BRAAE|nr:unnamed protein product [Brassicogethes aeneus]